MATYAHIENNIITGVYDLIPNNWRNISNFYVLAENFDDIRSLGWRTIQKISDPVINIDTQRYGELIHTIENDEVVETREVITLPVAPVVVNVIGVKAEYISSVGVLDGLDTVLAGVTVIVPVAFTEPYPPVNGIL